MMRARWSRGRGKLNGDSGNEIRPFNDPSIQSPQLFHKTDPADEPITPYPELSHINKTQTKIRRGFPSICF